MTASTLLGGLALFLTACVDHDLGHDSRILDSWQVGGQMLSMQAGWAGRHYAGGLAPEFRWSGATNNFRFGWRLTGDELRLASDGANADRVLLDRNTATQALAALSIDACSRDDVLVTRVHDPGADQPPSWQVAYVVGRTLLTMQSETAGTSCQAVLDATPGWDQWLHLRARGEAACALAREGGRQADRVRCLLRGEGGPRWVLPPEIDVGPIQAAELLQADVADAVFAAVAVGTDLEADGPLASGLVFGTNDDERRRAWIDDVVAACETAECPTWQVQAAAMVAAEVATQQRIQRQNEHAAPIKDDGAGGNADCTRLARAALTALEAERGAQALAMISPVVSCADPRVVAGVMHAGLSVPSAPEIHLHSPDAVSYAGADPDCSPAALVQPGGRLRPYNSCSRLPRLAGSWLALHCDAKAVKLASAAAADAAGRAPDGDLDPRTDQVLDGALRVLGACSPRNFERAISGAPDLPASVTSADARGQDKLRMLFLPADE